MPVFSMRAFAMRAFAARAFSARTISLQQRLLRNLLAVLLPLGLVVTTTAMIATQMAAEDMAGSLTRQSIKQTSDELELYFAAIDQLLGAARDWARSGLLNLDEVDQPRRLMQPLLANQPQVSSFLLADERGHELMLLQTDQGWRLRQTHPKQPGQVRWLAWSGDPNTPTTTKIELNNYDPRDRPWFRGALKAKDVNGNPQVHWTGPYQLLTTGDSGMTASLATLGPEDERLVVALDVLLLDITRFTRNLALSEHGGVIVLDDQAQLIGLPGDPRLSKLEAQDHDLLDGGNTSDNVWPALSAAENAFAGVDNATQLIRFRSEGQAWWGARKPFQLTHDQRLWIEVLVPESELLDGLAALPYAVVLILLAVIAAAGWRMHAVSRRFSEPITQLVAASERLRQGDFRQSPPLGTNISELRRLQKAQNRMRIGLQSLMRLERDLQLAREIQQAALPKILPTLPGFDLDVWTEPADETGGDTYDVIPRTQGEGTLLMLADATGHGIGPALTATEVRALLRMAVRTGLGLNAIAAQLNDQLHEDLGQGRFVTAWLAEVASSQHRVRTLSAGQAPILRFHRAKGQCEILSADGPPLGVLPGMAPSASDWWQMEPGDIIAVISDGIYEAVNAKHEQFGSERTIAVINANHEQSARTIRETLLAQLAEFTRGQGADDDRTILILKAKTL